MRTLPSKKFSFILLACFYTFDAFSSYYAVQYLGAKEGNLVIAPYVEKTPLLFFPIMVFGYILNYCIYYVFTAVLWFFLKNTKHITKPLIERVVLASIAIFYFFTVILNNSLYILGFRMAGGVKINLITGIVIALIYGILMLYQKNKFSSPSE
jgi:hypothetical protein